MDYYRQRHDRLERRSSLISNSFAQCLIVHITGNPLPSVLPLHSSVTSNLTTTAIPFIATSSTGTIVEKQTSLFAPTPPVHVKPTPFLLANKPSTVIMPTFTPHHHSYHLPIHLPSPIIIFLPLHPLHLLHVPPQPPILFLPHVIPPMPPPLHPSLLHLTF